MFEDKHRFRTPDCWVTDFSVGYAAQAKPFDRSPTIGRIGAFDILARWFGLGQEVRPPPKSRYLTGRIKPEPKDYSVG